MKPFKDFLHEKVTGLSNIGDVKHIIFREGNAFPLSETMLKRIFGDLDNIEGFHVTGWGSISKMIKLQNSKKSISIFTKIDSQGEILNGAVNGGVVFKVQGQKLGGGKNDIMSLPDPQGRRWIVDRETKLQLSKKVLKDMDELKFNMLDAYLSDEGYDRDILNKIKATDKKWKVGDLWSEGWYNFWGLFSGKTKSSFIKDYIDGAEKIVKKHKNEFKKAIFDAEGSSGWGSWDEQVINKVKIKEVLVASEDWVYTDYKQALETMEDNSQSINDLNSDLVSQYKKVQAGFSALEKNKIKYSIKRVSDILRLIKKG